GSTFRMCRSFVQMSKLHPTPQYVHTVFVFRIRDSRIAASASDTRSTVPNPVSFSTPFTSSIIPLITGFASPVRKPACPIIDFSISALHGHTVTQCPHETQLDPAIVSPPSHSTRGCASSHRIDSVSFTCTSWHACTQRPQRMHWSGSYR